MTTMTDNAMTIHEQAQAALGDSNCAHPNIGIIGLRWVLAQLAPDSLDAEAIKRAINQLEEIADAIAGVKALLADANFSFEHLDLKIAKLETALDHLGLDSSDAEAIISAGEHPD